MENGVLRSKIFTIMRYIKTYKLITEGKSKLKLSDKMNLVKSYEAGFNKIIKDNNIDIGEFDDIVVDFKDEIADLIIEYDKYYQIVFAKGHAHEIDGSGGYDDEVSLPIEYDDCDASDCDVILDSCRGFYLNLRKKDSNYLVSYCIDITVSKKFDPDKYKTFFEQIDLRCKSEGLKFIKYIDTDWSTDSHFLQLECQFPIDKSTIIDPNSDTFKGIPQEHLNSLLDFTAKKKFSEKDNIKLAAIITNIMNSKSGSLNEAKKMVNYDAFFKLNYDNFQNIIKNNNIDVGELDDMTLSIRDDLDVYRINKSQCFYIKAPNGRNVTLYVDENNFFDFEDNTEKSRIYREILEFFVKNKILNSIITFKYTMHMDCLYSKFDLKPYFNEIKSRCDSIDVDFKQWTTYSGISVEFSCKIDKSTVLDPNEIPLDKGKLSKEIDSKLGDLMARKRFTQKDKEDLMDIIKSISKN